MTIVLILLAALIALLFWLLWMPLRVEVNTMSGVFLAEWRHVAALRWLPDAGPWGEAELRVPFFRKRFSVENFFEKKEAPAPPKPTPPKQESPRKSVKKSPQRSFRFALKLAQRVLKTIHVRRFRLLWDSDDFVLNAWLFPIFWFLKTRGKQVVVNFQGQRELDFLVEMRPGAAMWAVAKSFIFKR